MRHRQVMLGVLLLAAQPLWAQTARVLLVGDSWAEQQWQDGVHALVFAANGAGQYGVVGDTTTESGSTAAEWATPAWLQRIGQALDENPGIDTVQLTIGGNDFLDAWSVDLPPAAQAALREQIRTDLGTVVDYVLAARPDMEVVISLYDYPNFRDTLDSLAGFFVCRPLHESLGAPTPLQLNQAMAGFEAELATLAAHPRVHHVGHAGQMQFTFGIDGFAPGELLPPADPSRPSPVSVMRDHGLAGRDCFHLTPDGYDVLVQNLYENFFQVRFDTLLHAPFE